MKSSNPILGINAVTRAIEKNTVALVILSKKVQSSIVIQHVPSLCYLANVPLCSLGCESSELGKILGLSRAIAIAIKVYYRLSRLFFDYTER